MQNIIDLVSKYTCGSDNEIITMQIEKKYEPFYKFQITDFKIINNEVVYASEPYRQIGTRTGNSETNDFVKIILDTVEEGFYIIRFNNKKCTDFKYYAHYNLEVDSYNHAISFLMIYLEYNIFPGNEDAKKELENSLIKEKLKETLVYACYENNMDKIKKYLESAERRDFGKCFYSQTPLMFCAENDNLEAFKMLIDTGANIKQVFNQSCALEVAIAYSKDITMYIYENFYEYFKKKVTKEGFSLAVHCHDTSIFKLFKDCGVSLEGKNKKTPNLHKFAIYNNVEGVRFLIENGVNPLMSDGWEHNTAYTLAKKNKCKNTMKYLEQFN